MPNAAREQSRLDRFAAFSSGEAETKLTEEADDHWISELASIVTGAVRGFNRDL